MRVDDRGIFPSAGLREHAGSGQVSKKVDAPCRRVVGGVRYRDEDDDGMRVEHVHYACGCQTSRDVFHDGSVTHRVVHHNGKVLVHEEFRGE